MPEYPQVTITVTDERPGVDGSPAGRFLPVPALRLEPFAFSPMPGHMNWRNGSCGCPVIPARGVASDLLTSRSY
jgi:hypothetical protein